LKSSNLESILDFTWCIGFGAYTGLIICSGTAGFGAYTGLTICYETAGFGAYTGFCTTVYFSGLGTTMGFVSVLVATFRSYFVPLKSSVVSLTLTTSYLTLICMTLSSQSSSLIMSSIFSKNSFSGLSGLTMPN
jgi:hypothetical protein